MRLCPWGGARPQAFGAGFSQLWGSAHIYSPAPTTIAQKQFCIVNTFLRYAKPSEVSARIYGPAKRTSPLAALQEDLCAVLAPYAAQFADP